MNYEELPPSKVAVLIFGLKNDSRLKMKMRGDSVTDELLMQAKMVDSLNFLCWAKTADAQNGRNRPQSMVELLLGKRKETDIVQFESGEDFEEYRRSLICQK